jgi:hypothetical protein
MEESGSVTLTDPDPRDPETNGLGSTTLLVVFDVFDQVCLSLVQRTNLGASIHGVGGIFRNIDTAKGSE